MIIAPVRNNNFYLSNKFNKTNTPTTNQNNNYKQHNFKNIENISFNGLGFFQPKKPAIDARYITQDFQMPADYPYLVLNDSVFILGRNSILNLSNPDVKEKIDNLKPNQSIIFGTEKTPFIGINEYVSAKHLKIQKNSQNQLVATDLNSTNGTIIKKNINVVNEFDEGKNLIPYQKYFLPKTAVLRVGDTVDFYLSDYLNKINSLKPEEKLYVGRGNNNDIKIDNEYISKQHLAIENHEHGAIVTDLNSLNKTRIGKLYHNPYIYDYSQINKITPLRKETPTLLPRECQLYLGNDFTIDTRNSNILSLLDQKGSVSIGRNFNCDLIVNDFHEQVSRKHLKLEKYFDDIIATDLNSTNDTQVVPKNQIRPFYNPIGELELKQANIGDCYLLATLYALSKSKNKQHLLENMVRVDAQGNYFVYFYNQNPIIVRPNELDGEIQGNERKYSVSGDLGLKAIERAYGKLIKQEKLEAERNFLERLANKNFKDKYENRTLSVIEGGFPNVALEKITGLKSEYLPLCDINETKNVLNKICYNNAENYIITCYTQEGKYNNNFYVDPLERFCNYHAYAIKSIDPYWQAITITNPHNTKRKEHVISWDEFNEYFYYMNYADTRQA